MHEKIPDIPPSFNSFEESAKILKISFWKSILLLLIFIVSHILTRELTLLFQNKPTLYINTLPLIWLLPFIFTFVIYYYLFMKPKGEKYTFNFTLSKPFYIYPIFIIAFIGLFLMNEFLISIINDIPTLKEWYKSIIEETSSMLSKHPIIMTFMIVILAPIFEEILFRGIILKGLLNKGMNPYWSIFLSSFIFGLVHANPWQFVGATLLGCFIGWVFYKTHSLLNCIILHFLNNAVACYCFFMYKDVYFSDVTGYTNESLFLIGIFVLGIFGYIFYRITKNIRWISY